MEVKTKDLQRAVFIPTAATTATTTIIIIAFSLHTLKYYVIGTSP